MTPHPQLLSLAAKVPMRLIRFKYVMKDVIKNEATLRMYHGPDDGPAEKKYYCEIKVKYLETVFEDKGMNSKTSLAEFLRILLEGDLEVLAPAACGDLNEGH